MNHFSIAATVFALAIGLNTAQAGSLPGRTLVQGTVPGIATQVQYESGHCRHLRYACEYKHRLGEGGEGNCRRYREECRSGYERPRYEGRSYCDRLRNACVYKESRGETGEGNCRRYREECRGS
jgi:hypothetical protein